MKSEPDGRIRFIRFLPSAIQERKELSMRYSFTRQPAAYAVIGLGRFGTAVAETLVDNGQEVILIDKDPDRVRDLRYLSDYAYVISHMDQKALEEIGVGDVQVAIVCIGSAMDVNILTTLYCVNLKVPRVIAKANSLDQGQILSKIGAEVVYPEREMGKRLANQLLNKRVMDYFSVSGNIDVAQISIPEEFIGRKLDELNMRQKWGISIIAIQRGNSSIEDVQPGFVFEKGDNIIIIGSNDNIQRFEEEFDED